MIKYLFSISLFLFSCDITLVDEELPDSNNDLNIYDVLKQNDSLDQDSSGYYHFLYNPTGISQSDYGTVKYTTELPITRVFWESPDSFFIYHMNDWFGEPIINNSTYSGDDGYGQQLFYIYSDFIGDTLTIYGYISSVIIDSVFIIVE